MNLERQFDKNCFDYLKLIGAYIVIFSHSFRWFEIAKPKFLLFLTDGATGVMIFFAASGFLVMASYERHKAKGKSLISFYGNRLKRIYPALTISFLVVVLVNTCLLKLEFNILLYFKEAVKYLFFGISGQYMGQGITNGVLWTIPVTLCFYLISPMIYEILRRARDINNIYIYILILVFWQFNLWDWRIYAILQRIPKIGNYLGISFPIYFIYEFMIGAALYMCRDKFFEIIDKKLVIALLAVYTLWFCTLAYSEIRFPFGLMHDPISGLIVPVLTIALAYYFGEHKLKMDITFGLFLYHMIVLQVLMHLGIKGYIGIFLVAVITPMFACLSCKYVEQKIK